MENFTNEQVEQVVDFYKQIGIRADDFVSDGKIKDIFSLLGIKPEISCNGSRVLTPYEILGLLPHVEGGVEKPIVFIVKNKIKNLKAGKILHESTFFFSKEKNQTDNSMIEFVVRNYKNAIMQNNLAEAERQYEMLDKLTGGKAKHYIGTFFDYTKFYKQMKKQLLIDLFSHFFLIYLLEKKSIIKKGLIIKNKKFKPYDTNKQFLNKAESLMPEIKSIRIDDAPEREETLGKSDDSIQDIEFDKTIQKANNSLSQEVKNITMQKECLSVKTMPRQSFIKRLKKRLSKKDRQKNFLADDNQSENLSANAGQLIKKTEKEVSYE